MSAFLVISTSDKLNWIVDGIEKCRPLNPNVETFIGTGKLEHRAKGLYYVHNYTANDDTNNCEEEVSDLQCLIANQFAHFRSASGVRDNLQIFILDNPIDEKSLEYSQKIYNQIDNVINQEYENDCSLTRILFSYDVSRPCDVCSQVNSHILQSNIADAADKVYTQICYIDNQNRVGAAMALSPDKHNLMLPRMLCDFMMLMSSENTQYNIRNAANNDTKIFSLGYAECMYYYEDIQRYFETAYQYGIRLRILNENNVDEDFLDYNKYPLGITERVQRLHPIYCDVPFDCKITDFPESIDKSIDDIIVELHDDIIAIKEKALKEAQQKDEDAAQRQREETGDESIIVTIEQNKVQQDYPDYIDRQSIYSIWILERMPNETFEGNSYCQKAKEEYLHLIKFIQTPLFRKFINSSDNANTTTNSATPDNTIPQSESRKGCNIFARIFRKNKAVENIVQPSNKENCGEKSLIEKVFSIADLLRQKEQYKALCAFEDSLKQAVKQKQKEMDDFMLTSHCASYSSLIDVDKLKQYQRTTAQKHFDTIILSWKNREERNLKTLYDETEQECTKELSQFKYINWNAPAPFIEKDIDIADITTHLVEKSIPWVNSLVIRSEKENSTTYTFYTDYEKWKQLIEDKQIELPSNTTLELSSHISSKIVIFQILQWDEHIKKGLTDTCGQKKNIEELNMDS